ncbi:MAG: signal peptidase I [Nitriliruptoraceae bacterium]|jgi:signal peptidase I
MSAGLRTAGIVAAVVAWLLVGPRQLSGPVAAVSTSGQSMAPTYRPHHLVVVKRAASYDVGDVVAYRSASLDTVVLHRIVDRDSDGFITKGDNNDWIDPDRPDADDIIGRVWLAVPQLGRLFELPAPATPVFLVAGVIGLTGSLSRRRSTPPQRPQSLRGALDVMTGRYPAAGRPPAQLMSIAMIVLLVTIGLSAAAWTRPARVDEPVDFGQRAEFSYDADVAFDSVYPDGRVDTGDLIFLRLINELQLTLDWTWETGQVRNLAGIGQLSARITDSSGWQTTISLGPAVEWTGAAATLTGTLDLDRVQQLAAEARSSTGIGDDRQTVTITADLEVEGVVAGTPVADTFSPSMTFNVTPLRATLSTPPDATDEPSTGGLVFTDTGSVTAPAAAANHVTIAGRAIPVQKARWVTLALLALATPFAVLTAVGARRAAQSWSPDEHAVANHGSRIINVASLSPARPDTTVAVIDLDELVALASHHDLPILRALLDGGGYSYVVIDDAAVRYCSTTAPNVAPEEPATPDDAASSDAAVAVTPAISD